MPPQDYPVLLGLTARELAAVASPLLAGASTLLFLMAVFEPKMAVPARVGLVTMTTASGVLAAALAYQSTVDKRRLEP